MGSSTEQRGPAPRRYLTQNDAIMWTVEADPLLRSTIVGVVVLDRPPDWNRLVARVEHAVRQVPELRERIVPVPLHPTTFRWEPDPGFELSSHLRRVVAPPGATMRDVLDLAGEESRQGVDRHRPLWRFTLVEGFADGFAEGVAEGFADGRAALVMTAHHVLTDGIGAVQLATHLFDLVAESSSPEEHASPAAVLPAPGAPEVHGVVGAVREMVRHDLAGVYGLARATLPHLVPALIHAVRDPYHAVVETVRTAESIGRVVTPVTTTLSPVMVDRQTVTRFEHLEVPMDALRAAAASAAGTLNDGFLAAVTGGLRRYHTELGAEIEDLRMAMPVSLRGADDAPGGNHVTVMRFTVPAGVPDADERIRRLHDIGRRLRAERSLAHTETIAGVLNLVPHGVIGAMLKHVDVLTSNVPGIGVPLSLAGSRVLRWFPFFGPTAGSAVNVTLMSYDGTCCIGVNVDTAAVTDVELLVRCLREGFDEVLALADPVEAAASA